jgi:peptide deformylase
LYSLNVIALKGLKDLLLLGDPQLYEVCTPVLPHEWPMIGEWVSDLNNAMKEVRAQYHFGRAIAAPQLGIMKRLIYMNIDRPVVFVNPELTPNSEEQFERWDDCMCFPNLLVKVKRYTSVTVKYQDEHAHFCAWKMENDLSELLQHEYDHLNGILCTMRAVDERSFKWRR